MSTAAAPSNIRPFSGPGLKVGPPVDDGYVMSPDFAVRCTDCGFRWNSAAMAEGLRLLGSCPKCKGELEFRADAAAHTPERAPADAATAAAPHMVLGIPRI